MRWSDLSAEDRAALDAPGRLIAAQREFAEAAVDSVLRKYLGWWKSGERHSAMVEKVRAISSSVARVVAFTGGRSIVTVAM